MQEETTPSSRRRILILGCCPSNMARLLAECHALNIAAEVIPNTVQLALDRQAMMDSQVKLEIAAEQVAERAAEFAKEFWTLQEQRPFFRSIALDEFQIVGYNSLERATPKKSRRTKRGHIAARDRVICKEGYC
ncbi:hypothetical protein G8759_19925 [Spirosoma aureum]|uniref:Uncharacterized protein n=1 Tax=Spirosoma aureum TaxID=2692134 RepID=A0A6G9AQN7_9BACT|nr:hypothetical protein [Spirosoma aureum]QIP14720.1 hypothetical protein G8759_19925 [Spirosoma aureum]